MPEFVAEDLYSLTPPPPEVGLVAGRDASKQECYLCAW